MQDRGKLYVVATPIGNLEDITIRALTILKEVTLIAAEDTRQTKKLLNHYQISTPLTALHAFNEKNQSGSLLMKLCEGQSVAYVSDAGTPLISDPGAYLVKLAHDQGFQVVPIPGPCAAITALSASGFTGPFFFEGFLPSKSAARKQRLTALIPLESTLVFYEAPHRILDFMADILFIMGNREAVIARELTKKFETIQSGTLEQLSYFLHNDTNQQRGEFVVIVAGALQAELTPLAAVEEILSLLLEELSVKQAVKIASKIVVNRGKNELYSIALRLAMKHT